MAEEADGRTPASWRTGAARLAVGLAQGVAIWALIDADDRKLWPSQTPPLSAALLLALALVPLIVIFGLGRIRRVPLAIWAAAAGAVLAWFAWHDIDARIWDSFAIDRPRLVPAFEVFFFGAVFVFVGHHLVGPADEARRLVAPYRSYFDWAWKDAVQVVLSFVFLGVLWGALLLGAELFRLIGVEAVANLVQKRWFAFPITGAAFATAVQLTDVRVALIRGVRTVGLVLLSWLLPVMTFIVAAFLAALPFTGLGHLFGATSAAATMLWASAALIVLVSAAYQDGEGPTPLALRWAARAAGLALTPLTLIAAAALWLRIRQYGLTPARIEAAACAFVAAGFAVGYAAGAVRRKGPWMKPLELTNIVMARAAMLAIVLVFTPIADPARLAVGDQVKRLMAGETAPGAFDYAFLIYRGGRYGADALKELIGLKGDALKTSIAQYAAMAQQNSGTTPGPLAPPVWWRQAHVYPAGAALPAAFIQQNQTAAPSQAVLGPEVSATSACFALSDVACEAFVLDIDGDGAPEVLLSQGTSYHGGIVLQAYKPDAGGVWAPIGTLEVNCPDALAALRAGKATLERSAGYDLDLAGHRQRLMIPDDAPCPTPAVPLSAARVSPVAPGRAIRRP